MKTFLKTQGALGVLVILGFLFVPPADIFAQTPPADLEDTLNEGTVRLQAGGIGSSSGASVTGYLTNTTSSAVAVSIYISNGIYLRNSKAGQNMAAVQVYLADGRYYSRGTDRFITLEPKVRTEVIFIAFCADFEKENPTDRERFTFTAMPSSIQLTVNKISRYLRDTEGDLVNAAQIALWLAQGESISSISKKFRFAPEDETAAREILEY
ncbi:MAG: hypothetical protein LBK74_11245 [Treponema sp.]|nr:hypothetical protein [Treponema sp.]